MVYHGILCMIGRTFVLFCSTFEVLACSASCFLSPFGFCLAVFFGFCSLFFWYFVCVDRFVVLVPRRCIQGAYAVQVLPQHI